MHVASICHIGWLRNGWQVRKSRKESWREEMLATCYHTRGVVRYCLYLIRLEINTWAYSVRLGWSPIQEPKRGLSLHWEEQREVDENVKKKKKKAESPTVKGRCSIENILFWGRDMIILVKYESNTKEKKQKKKKKVRNALPLKTGRSLI